MASAIWDLMREDESLRFDDVAVLVPPGELLLEQAPTASASAGAARRATIRDASMPTRYHALYFRVRARYPS